MRPPWLLALLLLAPALAAPAEEHFDPLLLNERAVRAARAGDMETARILLERALRLAPHDRRLAANLEALDAGREGWGRETGWKADEMVLPAALPPPAPAPALSEPPPPWPDS